MDMPPSVPPDRPDVRRRAPSVTDDLVVGQRAGSGRDLEPVADLDALDRLDAHQRTGEPGVEPPVPVHVRAEPGRQPVRPPPRRPRRACRRPCGPGRSARPSAWRRRGPGSAPGRRRGSATSSADGHRPRRGGDAAELHDVGDQPGTGGLLEERARPRRPSATRAAVSRAEARSRIGRASSKPYFCMPDEVGVAGPGPGQGGVAGQRVELDGVDRVGGHHLLPLGPLGVADLDGDRAALGQAVPDAAGDPDLVLLELHPGTPAVAEPAPGERVRDVRGRHLHMGRESLQDRGERRGRGTPPP